MPQNIPLAALAQYPSYLTSRDGNARSAIVNELRDLARFDPEHRATLVDAIMTDLTAWSAPPAAVEAASLLREPGSYAIVTGQQAGIATGPLYSLYKAIGAIRVARDAAIRHAGHQFVAVFWIEADDHDFDEARRIGVIDRSGTTRTLSYDDGDAAPRHVGDRVVQHEAFASFIEELRATLIETEFTTEMVSALEHAYLSEGATLASGFARCMYAILGDVPLVMVSSRNPRLKWLARDVFERDARDPDALFASLRSRTDELRAAGATTPITPKRGSMYMTHDGARRAIDAQDDNTYTLREVGVRYSREELASLVLASPEMFSPNVALRPIVQDAVLPTAAYVGGPSELAYLEQVIGAYGAFELEPPELTPRPFVLLMEPKARRVLEQAELTIEEVMSAGFSAADHAIDERMDAEIEEIRERAITATRDALEQFSDLTKRIDPTLEKALGATGAGVEKSIEDFSKKLRSALKRKSQTVIDRIETARELILPDRELQERTLNAAYYINKYGLERFGSALNDVESVGGVMQVIDL